MGSAALAAGLVAWVARSAAPAAVPAVLGVALLVAALTLGRAGPVGPSVALLGFGNILATIGRPVDAGAVLYGTGLLAVAELAFWSLDLRGAAEPPLGAHRRRWIFVAATCAASAVLGGAVLLAGAVAPGGAAREVAAALGVVGVGGLLVGLARGAMRRGRMGLPRRRQHVDPNQSLGWRKPGPSGPGKPVRFRPVGAGLRRIAG